MGARAAPAISEYKAPSGLRQLLQIGALELSADFWISSSSSSGFPAPRAPGSSWKLRDAPGSSWKLLDAPGSSWALLEAPGSSWMLLEAQLNPAQPSSTQLSPSQFSSAQLRPAQPSSSQLSPAQLSPAHFSKNWKSIRLSGDARFIDETQCWRPLFPPGRILALLSFSKSPSEPFCSSLDLPEPPSASLSAYGPLLYSLVIQERSTMAEPQLAAHFDNEIYVKF